MQAIGRPSGNFPQSPSVHGSLHITPIFIGLNAVRIEGAGHSLSGSIAIQFATPSYCSRFRGVVSRLPNIVEDLRSRTHANGSKEEDEEKGEAYGEEEDDEAPEEEGLTTHRTRPAPVAGAVHGCSGLEPQEYPMAKAKAAALVLSRAQPAAQPAKDKKRSKLSARESGLFLCAGHRRRGANSTP